MVLPVGILIVFVGVRGPKGSGTDSPLQFVEECRGCERPVIPGPLLHCRGEVGGYGECVDFGPVVDGVEPLRGADAVLIMSLGAEDSYQSIESTELLLEDVEDLHRPPGVALVHIRPGKVFVHPRGLAKPFQPYLV